MAASHTLTRYPESLIEFITGLTPSSTLMLRAPNKREPGLFEQVMAKLALTLWLDVRWFRPDPGGGPGATFLRDLEMIREADLVLAYFATTTVIGGTAHLVDKAIDADTPVYSYGFTGREFVRLGEHDPRGAWSRSVPA